MPVQLATNITVELGASQRLRRRRVFLPLIDDLFLSGHGNEFFLLGLTLDCWLPTRSSTGPSGPPSHRNFHSPFSRKVVPVYSGVYTRQSSSSRSISRRVRSHGPGQGSS